MRLDASQRSSHLLFASWVRSIGFRYVTPNGLPMRQCRSSIDPNRHHVPENTPDTAQLNGGKAYEPSLNSEPGCIKVVDTFRHSTRYTRCNTVSRAVVGAAARSSRM